MGILRKLCSVVADFVAEGFDFAFRYIVNSLRRVNWSIRTVCGAMTVLEEKTTVGFPKRRIIVVMDAMRRRARDGSSYLEWPCR